MKRKRGPRLALPKNWPFLARNAKALIAATATKGGAHVSLAPAQLHSLGRSLLRIAHGERAGDVFEQKIKPVKLMEQTRATAYYRVRCANPQAPDTNAVRAAQAVYPNPPDTERIRRIARQYQESALRNLEAWSIEIKKNGLVVKTRTGLDTSELRAYLRRKGEHFKD